MTDVTQILELATQGDPTAANQLLPLVYDELRRLAAARLARENPGQTLEATALVHEAYVRLVGAGDAVSFANRKHFFAAASEAIRRILIENARRKKTVKHGGNLRRQTFDRVQIASPASGVDEVALSEALDRLKLADPEVAQLVSLRCFAGLTIREAAEVLGVAPRTADNWWAYARAWLLTELGGNSQLD